MFLSGFYLSHSTHFLPDDCQHQAIFWLLPFICSTNLHWNRKNSSKDEHIQKLDLQKDQQNELTPFETDYKRKNENSTLKIRNKKRDISDTEEMKRFIKISISNFYGGDTFKTLKKGMIHNKI